MATIIQLRRDTAANWTSADPILAQGEVGFETDTSKLKFGDGASLWSVLGYFGGTSGVVTVVGGTRITVDATDPINPIVNIDSTTDTDITTNNAKVGITTAQAADIVTNNAKVTNVDTNLSLGTITSTTMDVNSSDGTNATLISATATDSGLMTSAKFNEVEANTLKVTNATHTGEVTGSGALTVDPTTISNKALVTPVATDMVLLWDATDSALKRADASDFLSGGGVSIGDAIGSASANVVLYTDGSSNLAEDTDFIYDGTNLNVNGGYIDTLDGYYIDGKQALLVKNTSSVLVGDRSGNLSATGNHNFISGYEAGNAMTTATNCILMGYFAGVNLTTGNYNILLGATTGGSITTGSYNTQIGNGFKNNATDSDTVKIGRSISLATPTSSTKSVIIGGLDVSYTGFSMAYTAMLGVGVAKWRGDIAYSTFIGHKAGGTLTNLQDAKNAIAIGYYSGYGIGNNELSIGAIYNKTLISGNFSQDWAKIGGSLIVTERGSGTAVAGEIRYNTSTNKHEGYDGALWNAMY